MPQCAGHARFVYKYGLSMVNQNHSITKVNKRAMRS